ncbi:MAG: hypothetical protein IJL90_03635, partial [Lachnospiraceae bacterium]|nr:hypothetical protein [Lachnospiraceae bacterium]
MYKRYRQEWTKHLDFVIVEEISLQIAYLLAMYIRFGHILYPESMYKELAVVLFLIDFVVVMSLNTMHNVLKRGFFLELVETLKNCTAVFGFAVVYMYALKVSEDYSRILLFVTFLLHIVISYITRVVWKIILAHTKINDSRKFSMLVVVDPDLAEETIANLTAGNGEIYKIAGIVFTRKDKRTELSGIPVVCDIEDASS